MADLRVFGASLNSIGFIVLISTCVSLYTYQLYLNHQLYFGQKKKKTMATPEVQVQRYLNNPDKIFQFEIGKDDSDEFEDCKHVVKEICTEWTDAKNEDITVKIICGGITNRLYRLNYKELSVLVRIYGENTEVMIDRENDNYTFAELSRRDFAPTYYGRFLNGRVEGWVEGRPLEPIDMGQVEPINYVALIGKEMAVLHAMNMKFDKKPVLWTKLQNFETLANEVRFDDPIQSDLLDQLNLEKIARRVQWLQSILPSHKNNDGKDLLSMFRGSPITKKAYEFINEVVFCHNDALSGNILHNENWDHVQLIDYEYGGYNYRGFDFANHFCEHCGFDMDLNCYPSKETQLIFYKSYLSSINPSLLRTLQDENELNIFLDGLYDAGNLFVLASHLFWGLWAIVQAGNSSIDFDFLNYARQRFDCFECHIDMFCPTLKDV